MRVAVVDDRSVNRMMARTMLEQAGALVYEFADGSALLRGLRMPDASIQAVLMDLQMEPMDGLEATRLIRADASPRMNKLPILAMTGNLMRNEQELTRQAGMNGFLSKPLLYEDLVRQLRSHVWGLGRP